MHQGFPITIKFDSQITVDKRQTVAASKIEMWINFNALKNGWYADENCVLEIEFILLEQSKLAQLLNKHANDHWQIEQNQQFAIMHDKNKTHADAYIAIDSKVNEHFEAKIKTTIITIANIIIEDYGFIKI